MGRLSGNRARYALRPASVIRYSLTPACFRRSSHPFETIFIRVVEGVLCSTVPVRQSPDTRACSAYRSNIVGKFGSRVAIGALSSRRTIIFPSLDLGQAGAGWPRRWSACICPASTGSIALAYAYCPTYFVFRRMLFKVRLKVPDKRPAFISNLLYGGLGYDDYVLRAPLALRQLRSGG